MAIDDLTGMDNSTEPRDSNVSKFTTASSKVISHQGNLHQPINFNFQIFTSEDGCKEDLTENLKSAHKHLSFSRSTQPSHYVSLSKFLSRLIKKGLRKINRKKSIEILQIINTCQNDTKTFAWGWISPPIVGDEIYGPSLPISGWVIGRNSQPVSMRFLVNQTIVAETPINIPRPDVVKALFVEYKNCGYSAFLDVEMLHGGEIVLEAVFPEGHTAKVGSARFCKYG